MAATGNFASYLAFLAQRGMAASSEWHGDLTKVTFGSGTVYAYAFVVAPIVAFALRYFGARVSIVQVICV